MSERAHLYTCAYDLLQYACLRLSVKVRVISNKYTS